MGSKARVQLSVRLWDRALEEVDTRVYNIVYRVIIRRLVARVNFPVNIPLANKARRETR